MLCLTGHFFVRQNAPTDYSHIAAITEFLYDINSSLIAVLLFVSMTVTIELGYRLGAGIKQK